MIYLTRHPNAYLKASREKYPVDELLRLFRSEREKGTPFRVFHPIEDGASFALHILKTPMGAPNTLVELDF